MTLFDDQYEQEAIERIKKFANIAQSLGIVPTVGFSGGKDSQVVYDLCCRAGIKFEAYFNHAFENAETLNFIRNQYPAVKWRRLTNEGFVQNIIENHNSLLPTVEMSFCCEDYKHSKEVKNEASIVGVRMEESNSRKNRRLISVRLKKVIKKTNILDFFSEKCIENGGGSILKLSPIIEWSESDVWNYIKKHNLPINPNYKKCSRVGCCICPKASFSRNFIELMKHPKWIDAFIKAREKRTDIDWIIRRENKDYSDNKVEYICKWLNHSFREFSKKDAELFEKFKEVYDKQKKQILK